MTRCVAAPSFLKPNPNAISFLKQALLKPNPISFLKQAPDPRDAAAARLGAAGYVCGGVVDEGGMVRVGNGPRVADRPHAACLRPAHAPLRLGPLFRVVGLLRAPLTLDYRWEMLAGVIRQESMLLDGLASAPAAPLGLVA